MARKSHASGSSTPSRATPSQNTQAHSSSTLSSSTTPSGTTVTATTTTTTPSTASTSASSSKLTSAKPSTSSSTSSSLALQDIIPQIWNSYVDKTPQRTKLIDAFMAFLLVVGGVQFVYCVLFGNYPYNAFLSGFGITVGQFVLTASLRIQTNVENAAEFKSVSPERAFADYVLGSLILHFFCVNFIN